MSDSHKTPTRKNYPGHRRKRLAWVGAGLVLLVGLAFLVTQEIYFFPLTPLGLDRSGTTRLPPAGRNVRILFAGDTMLGDAARSRLEDRGYDYPFGATRQVVRQADLAILNLEGPVAVKASRNTKKRWSYKMPPKAAQAIAKAGFHGVSLANNHVLDCGPAGLAETRAYVQAAGLTPFGAGLTRAEAYKPLRRTIKGIRIAVFGFIAPAQMKDGKRVSNRGLGWRPGRGGVAWGGIRETRQTLLRWRPRVDLIVVMLHMGDRYQRAPEGFERAYVRALLRNGADAVIGVGTHILGPIGVHHGKPIFYGLGNYAFGSSNLRARFSLMASLEADPITRHLVRVQALPLYTVNYNPMVWFQPRLLVGRPARRVLSDLAHRSWSRGADVRVKASPLRAEIKLLTVKARTQRTWR